MIYNKELTNQNLLNLFKTTSNTLSKYLPPLKQEVFLDSVIKNNSITISYYCLDCSTKIDNKNLSGILKVRELTSWDDPSIGLISNKTLSQCRECKCYFDLNLEDTETAYDKAEEILPQLIDDVIKIENLNILDIRTIQFCYDDFDDSYYKEKTEEFLIKFARKFKIDSV